MIMRPFIKSEKIIKRLKWIIFINPQYSLEFNQIEHTYIKKIKTKIIKINFNNKIINIFKRNNKNFEIINYIITKLTFIFICTTIFVLV